MSASPEFYKPAQAPAYSPSCCATQPLVFGAGAGAGDDYSSCRTPTGGGISYLREPTTCPPAPRKPPPPMCRKRLFQAAASADQQHQPCESPNGAPLISLRLDELERLFRPHPPPPTTTAAAAADKRRRSGSGSVSRSGKKHGHHLDTELRSLN